MEVAKIVERYPIKVIIGEVNIIKEGKFAKKRQRANKVVVGEVKVIKESKVAKRGADFA